MQNQSQEDDQASDSAERPDKVAKAVAIQIAACQQEEADQQTGDQPQRQLPGLRQQLSLPNLTDGF